MEKEDNCLNNNNKKKSLAGDVPIRLCFQNGERYTFVQAIDWSTYLEEEQ